MDDGTTVHIVRQPSSRKPGMMPLPTAKNYLPASRTPSQNVTVLKPIFLQPESQNWVEVTTESSGLVVIESKKTLFEKHQCLTGAGVQQVEPVKRFASSSRISGSIPFIFE